MKHYIFTTFFITAICWGVLPQAYAASESTQPDDQTEILKSLRLKVDHNVNRLTKKVKEMNTEIVDLLDELEATKACQKQWKFYDPKNKEADKKGCVNGQLGYRYTVGTSPKTCDAPGVSTCSVEVPLKELFKGYTAQQISNFHEITFTAKENALIAPTLTTSPNVSSGKSFAKDAGKGKGWTAGISYSAETQTATFLRGSYGWGNHYSHGRVEGIQAKGAHRIVKKPGTK